MKEDNEQIRTSYKFKVANSRFGKGCFSIQPIKKGEFICFFEGEELTWEKSERKYIEGEERLDDPLQISETKYIELDIPYIYFNHSCNPNSGIRGKNELIAIKNIKPGEEIFFDYSAVTWDDNWVKRYGPWTMKCGCKEKNCRKVIGDFLTIPESRRRKYVLLGIVPDFILRKLNEENKKY